MIIPAPMPTSANADRAAAEWVMSNANEVTVQVNGQERTMHTAADLPQEPFKLTGVHLAWSKKVTDASLAIFKDCRDLTSLVVGDTATTNAGLANFKSCEKLENLNLHGLPVVTNAGLAHFKDCKNLRTVCLGFTGVTDPGLAQFKECKNLTLLDLEATKVTAAAIKDLQLALPRCKITPDSDLRAARWVLGSGGQVGIVVDGEQIDVLKATELPRAEFKVVSIVLRGLPVNDLDLSRLKDLRNLKSLNLERTKVTDAGVAELKAALPNCDISH
jgi:hypothetical protein